MMATGVTLAKIAELSPLEDLSSSSGGGEWLRSHHNVSALLGAVHACEPTSQAVLDFYRDRRSLLEAYCRVLTRGDYNNTFSDEMKIMEWSRPGFQQVVEELLPIISTGASYIGAVPRFLQLVPIGSMAVYVTEEGRLGLAPRSAQLGDILCAFLGCPSAIALRPVSGSLGQYQVVGQSFLDRFMDRDCFLGPLPNEYTHDWRLDFETPEVDNLWSPGFVETSTGRHTWIDPRVQSFPIDMSRAHEETRAAAKEILGSITVEMLKERGVQIQEFALI
ncbi:hypothetical protein B0T24DRAFT_363697 [Lasiosphaeria ovina]|uniref:Uncharacterized protein n=1 Tax=Lasiosphaeria ovina TaxID=92902 RepID=A0AAE0K4W9_9PEZI|nr:hypothetical protein B0T24DRAFT_363697 [Lasiosphaeria ovina]